MKHNCIYYTDDQGAISFFDDDKFNLISDHINNIISDNCSVFTFCPICGKEINWRKIIEDLLSKLPKDEEYYVCIDLDVDIIYKVVINQIKELREVFETEQ